MVIKQFIGYGLLSVLISWLAYQTFYHLRNQQDGELIGALILVVTLAIVLMVVKIVRD
ncbi:MAG: hypothetical protein AB8G22_28775 [Saprospiraceae bacterium]